MRTIKREVLKRCTMEWDGFQAGDRVYVLNPPDRGLGRVVGIDPDWPLPILVEHDNWSQGHNAEYHVVPGVIQKDGAGWYYAAKDLWKLLPPSPDKNSGDNT